MGFLTKIASLIVMLASLSTPIHSLAQTTEEKAVMDSVNAYRQSKGLNQLSWDTSMYKMATHHSTYLSLVNSPPYNKRLLTHYENIDVEGFSELYDIDERIAFYVSNKNFYCLENCAIVNVWSGADAPKLASAILSTWLKSDKHKKALESKTTTTAACSVIYYDMEFKYKASDGSIKTAYVKTIAVTMDIH
jgi:hypothetical protein